MHPRVTVPSTHEYAGQKYLRGIKGTDGNNMTKLLMIATTFAVIHCGYAQCPALEKSPGDTVPAFKIKLSAKQSTAKADSPLWVEVTTSNPSDHDISFGKNTKSNLHAIDAYDEAGRPLPDKRPGFRRGRFDATLLQVKPMDPKLAKLVESGEIVRMLSGSLACVTLKPGESFVERIELTSIYDTSVPGSYTIAVEGYGPAKAGDSKPASVKVLVDK